MTPGFLSRLGVGQALWAAAAFFFPTLAVVRDESVGVAMLLFLLETLLMSALLAVRVGVARRQAQPAAAERLVHVRRVLQFFVAPFGLATAAMFGAVVAIEGAKGRLPPDTFATLMDRASWMAVMLAAGAALDAITSPVRSVGWLESAVSWQASRTSVMTLVLFIGWPIMLATGSSQAYFWVFFAFRLLCDLGSLASRERERIRERTFGPPFVGVS